MLVVAATVAMPATANTIIPPSEIVLHVGRPIAGLEFLPLLDQTLTGALLPQIRIVPTSFDVEPFRPRTGPSPASPILDAFALSLSGKALRRSMHVLIVTADIQLPPARFNFAVSQGGPDTEYRVMVVSLARLMAWDLRRNADTNPRATAARAARMIIKNSARLSGLYDSDRCVMAFPNSLQALDAMPDSYCEPDLSRLVAAGLARPVKGTP